MFGSVAPEPTSVDTTLCADVKTRCPAHSRCATNAVICDLTRVRARAEGRRLPPTCVFIYKAQAESRLGSARRLHSPRGPVHPVIWGFGCPWDGYRVARMGRLGPQVNLGGGGLRPPRLLSATTTTSPGLDWLSLTKFLCVGGHKNRRWGTRRPDGVCEAVSVGSVRQGTEVLSHKACSVSPGSWTALLPC